MEGELQHTAPEGGGGGWFSNWWGSSSTPTVEGEEKEREREEREREEREREERDNYVGWWRPTSRALLRDAEQAILKPVKSKFEQKMVKALDSEINTLIVGSGPPLVMLHGFGAGLAFWVCNYDYLAEHHTVYAIDLIGFARSGRPDVTFYSPAEAEEFFMNYIEDWRINVGLETFTMLGHSFGAYLSSVYTLTHPQHVSHLILADPWGIPSWADGERRPIPLKWRLFMSVAGWLPPLSYLRGLGPWGPALINRMRPDIAKKFVHMGYDATESEELVEAVEALAEGEAKKEVEENGENENDSAEGESEKIKAVEHTIPLVLRYVYHSNAQSPATGENGFHILNSPLTWAVMPLCDRLPDIQPDIPITFIYGSDSWMNPKAGLELMQNKLKNEKREYIIIPRSGHHIYIDNYRAFNRAVIYTTCNKAIPSWQEDGVEMDVEDFRVVSLGNE